MCHVITVITLLQKCDHVINRIMSRNLYNIYQILYCEKYFTQIYGSGSKAEMHRQIHTIQSFSFQLEFMPISKESAVCVYFQVLSIFFYKSEGLSEIL